MTPEAIAAICHEANRRYCLEIGDRSQRSWEEASWWQRQSAIAGVVFLMENPGAPPSALHDSWMARKLADGWKHGPWKSEEDKEHPCLVAYETLPAEQRTKDALFGSIARTLLAADFKLSSNPGEKYAE